MLPFKYILDHESLAATSGSLEITDNGYGVTLPENLTHITLSEHNGT